MLTPTLRCLVFVVVLFAGSRVYAVDFATKCQGQGVINCWTFDDPSKLYYNWYTDTACERLSSMFAYYTWGYERTPPGNATAAAQSGNRCMYPTLDTTVKHSGASALKFTIPTMSRDNSSGSFSEPFKRLPNNKFLYISPNSPDGNVLYFQFYQRFDANFLSIDYQCKSGTCYGWKQIIWYGNAPHGSSSSTVEVTQNNGGQRGFPQMYGQQGHDPYGEQDVNGCTYAKATSQGGSGTGYDSRPNYSAPLNPACVHFEPNRWMEFTGRIEVRGAANAPESRVQLWVDGQLVIDYGKAKINWDDATGGDGDGLGSFEITPFHTDKDETQNHPEGTTWYDDLIVSTQPIAMGNSAVDFAPSPPTNLTVK
jgi:hypothetical protein